MMYVTSPCISEVGLLAKSELDKSLGYKEEEALSYWWSFWLFSHPRYGYTNNSDYSPWSLDLLSLWSGRIKAVLL